MIKELVQCVFEQELNARCPKDSYEPGTFKCPPSVKDDKKSLKPLNKIPKETTTKISKIHEKLDVVSKKLQDAKKKRDDYFIKMKSLGPEKLDAMSEKERDKVMETGKKFDDEISKVVAEYNAVKKPLYDEYKMTKNEVLTEYAKNAGKKPEDVIYRSALGMVPEELIPTLDNVYNDMFRTTKGDHGILRKKR